MQFFLLSLCELSMSWSNVKHFQWKVVSTWLMDSQITAAVGAFNSSLEHIVRNDIVLGLLFLTVAFMLQHTHKCCNKGCCSSSLWSLHDASRFYPGFYLSISFTWLYLYHDLFYGGILSPQSCGYCGSHMMLRKKKFCSRIFNKRSYTEHLHMILQTEVFMAHLTLSSVFLWYTCICQLTTWLPWNFACWTFECKLVFWRGLLFIWIFFLCMVAGIQFTCSRQPHQECSTTV